VLVFSVVALLSVLLHVGIGWEATVLAGIVGGIWGQARWFLGGIGVALGWGLLVLYTPLVAPAAFRVLLDTVGAFGGNIPGEVFVGLTVFLGGVLGLLGAAIGRLLRLLVQTPSDTA
jgi:hypothetical protein